jgi:phosphate transport system substrate-binding protein
MKLKTILVCAMLGPFAASVLGQGVILVKGSDTIVNLVQRLAEVYMEKNPKAAVAVTGGGSGVGIAALINNQIAVADASRPMNPKEYTAAKENGVIPVEIILGIDGLCVVTSDAVGLKNLTTDQIGAIYRGDVTNWSEVGGPNLQISLYGRQPNSGTYVFFQEHILKNKNYSPKMKQMNGNAQIIEGIKAEKGGIGYVGVGYVYDDKGSITNGIRVLEVAKDTKSTPVSPLSAENVKTNLYPISRPLFQYVNGKPTAAVKAFITFELSAEGQKVVEEMGFYSVSANYKAKNGKAGF